MSGGVISLITYVSTVEVLSICVSPNFNTPFTVRLSAELFIENPVTRSFITFPFLNVNIT